ncbi:MAG: glycosyl transferase family 2 [Elusimicrobia bacterium GWA2_61_42]|nr:MAG: glycosyl transferase family 2 [Elusimicrobia bacterium GWA2_61_42]OGR76046.1 MAG: glycosyl transferase family 2 [Elusimicrobia bacterium GWC2_61_25]
MPKVMIVLPAYNAEKTLAATLADIPEEYRNNVILVDDCSTDKTVEVAKNFGITVIPHLENKGYGGNQKTCYREALKAGADIVVMLHPDYQYNPKVIPHLAGVIGNNICDMMLGNRIRTRRETLAGGMPFYKYLSNRFLSLLCNVATGENLGEWHSGMRAYSRKVLEGIPWEHNTDDFAFDMQFLVQASYFGYRMGDIPVETKYFEEASSINFSRSLKYGLHTLVILAQFLVQKSGLAKLELFKRAA